VFWRRIGGVAAVACACAALGGQPAVSAQTAQSIAKQRDGTVMIAGRSLRCGSMRNVLDPGLPNMGLAAPGVVVVNPRQLSRWPDTVRLFVFHHECGHHHVGGDELAADCWAVKEGVREGWLGRDGLGQVCRSFGGGPATATHPSGARRCASLDRCFTTAVAALAKDKAKVRAAAASADAKAATAEAKAAPITPDAATAAPKLLWGPTLRRNGEGASSEP
jgi:hypothetical protein